jgi:hypothetical protein
MRRLTFSIALLALTACTAEVITDDAPPAASSSSSHTAASVAAVSSVPPAPAQPAFEQSYTHKTDKYKISFPAGWTVKEKATSPLTYRKSAGTSFTAPKEYMSDTTLVTAIVFVERTRKPCVQFVNATDITLDGRQMQKGDSTAIGTMYYTRNTMYTLTTDSACYSIMLTVKACTQTDNCGENDHFNTFDPSELNKTFEHIVASFKPQ